MGTLCEKQIARSQEHSERRLRIAADKSWIVPRSAPELRPEGGVKRVQEIIGALVRHGLTGGGLVGVISEDEVKQLLGAIAALAGIVWSIWQKFQKSKDTTPIEQ